MHHVALISLAACGRLGFAEDPGGADGGPDNDDGSDAATVARITVEHAGTATGTVLGSDGFTCASGTCTLDVPIGTAVWLRGLPVTDAWFAGWTGKCGGNFECRFAATGDVTIEAEFAPIPNRVFVTSTTYDGAFGGIAAADAICSARATAAGLNGTFIAYLSDATTSAATRLTGSRGWVRTDGAPFADLVTAFSTGNIVFPLRIDETGNDLGSADLFTGTSGGVASLKHCLGWTSSLATDLGTGTYTALAAQAMFSFDMSCDQPRHLACVEIGRSVPVTIHPDLESPLAFQTTTLWTPGNGRASADAVCAADASSAGLSGTFLAALATTTESIESRFDTNATYRRGDGVRLLRAPGMFSTDFLDVPPELTSLGVVVWNDYWTGAKRWNVPVPASDNCADWTDGGATADGEMHLTGVTDLRTSAKREPCSTPLPVLCLQQ